VAGRRKRLSAATGHGGFSSWTLEEFCWSRGGDFWPWRRGPQPTNGGGVSVDGIGKAFLGLAQRVGSTRVGVLAIGRIVSPLQRELYRRTGGRVSLTGRAPVLLLTTTGRRTGKARTVPLLYLRDGDRLVVCNVNPGFERPNPWVLNLRADPHAQIQLGRSTARVRTRPASRHELDRYWPELTQIWPAYQDFYDNGGQRSVFVLEPDASPSPSQ
jgi:deazaflavin-dependent oxidoreductase (nitroreductase family)